MSLFLDIIMVIKVLLPFFILKNLPIIYHLLVNKAPLIDQKHLEFTPACLPYVPVFRCQLCQSVCFADLRVAVNSRSVSRMDPQFSKM